MFLELKIILEVFQTNAFNKTISARVINLNGWHVVRERIRLSNSDAGRELRVKADSDGSRLTFLAVDPILEEILPRGVADTNDEEVILPKRMH
jgi:hypothetical protein